MARAIDQFLAAIRQAIYGKDVREAIASGIEQCYNDSTASAQKADIEAKGAEVLASIPDTYEDLQNDVNDLRTFYSSNDNTGIVWGRGSLNSSTGGTSTANANKRCRSAEIMINRQTVICDNSVRFYLYFYNGVASSSTFVGNSGEWLHGCNISAYAAEHYPTADRFKILGSMRDDSNIGDGESADVSACSGHIYVLEQYAAEDELATKYGYCRVLTNEDTLANITACGAYRWTTNNTPSDSPTIVGATMFVFGPTVTSFSGKSAIIVNADGNMWTNFASSNGWGSTWHIHQKIEIDQTLSVTGKAADSKKVGDALTEIREDVSAAENEIAKLRIEDIPSFTWEQGNIDTDSGLPNKKNYDVRVRIVGDSPNGKIITKNGITVTVPSGLRIYSYKYSNDTITQGYIGSGSAWLGEGEYYFDEAPYYKFVAAYVTDGTNITPSDVSGITISRDTIVDTSLTVYNKAADAKAVGDRFALTDGRTEDYDVANLTKYNYSINDEGIWYSSILRHSIVALDNVRIVRVEASADNAVIAFLKESAAVEGEHAVFATGETGRRIVGGSSTVFYLVPDDTKYLFIYRGYSANNYANTPSSVIGYKMSLSVDCIKAAVAANGEPVNFVRDVPKNQGVRNAYKKMHQLLDVNYTTADAVPSLDDMPAGDYVGAIYSGTSDKAHYVGWNVSLRSYVTALHNPYSGMYTENTSEESSSSAYGVTYHGTNSSTPLGVVCAPFVAYALGMDIKWENHAWPYLASIGVLEQIADQSYTGVELCDTVYERGHVAIVSDIYRDNRGIPKLIYLSESYPPRGRTKIFTADAFAEYLAERPRTIYRYKDLYKNLNYQESEMVAVDGEDQREVYVFNDDICPYLGDYSVYREGELIAMCYTKGSYTEMIVAKNGSDLLTITLPSSSSTHWLDLRSYNLTEGGYAARLTNNSGDESEPALFNVVSLPISVSENGDSITVTFDSNKDPRYIQVCSLAGAARCVIPLTDNDKQAGTKTFDIRNAIDEQNSSIIAGTACYATVQYGVVDPAGYKLVRSSEFVPLAWID